MSYLDPYVAVASIVDAKSASDSATAASDLLQNLLPGGAVVAPIARDYVEPCNDGRVHIFDSPFRANLLALFEVLGDWIDGYRLSLPGSDLAKGEQETEASLVRFSVLHRQMVFDQDAEVRSLMSLLIASLPVPDELMQSVIDQFRKESNTLARGCLLQAIARRVVRSAWSGGCVLPEALQSAGQVEQSRISRELGVNRTPMQRDRMRVILSSVGISEIRTDPPLWPSEKVMN